MSVAVDSSAIDGLLNDAEAGNVTMNENEENPFDAYDLDKGTSIGLTVIHSLAVALAIVVLTLFSVSLSQQYIFMDRDNEVIIVGSNATVPPGSVSPKDYRVVTQGQAVATFMTCVVIIVQKALYITAIFAKKCMKNAAGPLNALARNSRIRLFIAGLTQGSLINSAASAFLFIAQIHADSSEMSTDEQGVLAALWWCIIVLAFVHAISERFMHTIKQGARTLTASDYVNVITGQLETVYYDLARAHHALQHDQADGVVVINDIAIDTCMAYICHPNKIAMRVGFVPGAVNDMQGSAMILPGVSDVRPLYIPVTVRGRWMLIYAVRYDVSQQYKITVHKEFTLGPELRRRDDDPIRLDDKEQAAVDTVITLIKTRQRYDGLTALASLPVEVNVTRYPTSIQGVLSVSESAMELLKVVSQPDVITPARVAAILKERMEQERRRRERVMGLTGRAAARPDRREPIAQPGNGGANGDGAAAATN